MSTARPSSPTPIIAIRPATVDDAAAVRRLAALDGAPVPTGDLLLGVVDGVPLAAVAVDHPTISVADPFRPTAELVELLRVRADRLNAVRAGRLPGTRRRRLGVLRRGLA